MIKGKKAADFGIKARSKIIIDLDVVTVAKWDKGRNGDLSRMFLIRAEKGEFAVYTPYTLLDLLDKWNHEKMKNKIKEFYILNSAEIITAQKVQIEIEKRGIDENSLTHDLKLHQIKEEDIGLIIMASLFKIGYLITLNRKHLHNKKEEINNVLQKYRLNAIKIA